MEPTENPVIPPLIKELLTFFNMCPRTVEWKRFRIAMTPAEIEEYKAFMKVYDKDRGIFIQAIRAVPIITEEFPKEPMMLMEYF